MRKVILTSFKKSELFKGEKFSVARWQPRGFKYPELKFLTAKDRFGNALHLSSYKVSPLKQYKEDWEKMVSVNWVTVDDWLFDLQNKYENLVLCCWCPYSNSTQEQIKRFGSFACHTGLIGQLIKKYIPKIEVILDDDRKNFLVKEWRL